MKIFRVIWKIVLLRNKKTNQCFVSFEGTDKWDHLIVDVLTTLTDWKFILEPFEKELNDWNTRVQHEYGGSIVAFIGHSLGGYLATHCCKFWSNIFRITFNSHKPERGENNVNLTLAGDPLKYLRINDRCIEVGKGGHKLINFEKYMEGKHDWSDFLGYENVSKHDLNLNF